MNLQQFLRIVEIRTKIISVSTYGLATLYAVYWSGSFPHGRFLIMLAAVLCVDMGTTAFNSYYDYRSGVDDRRYNTERDKVLVHDGVPAAHALWVALGLYGAAGVFGLAVSAMTSLWIAVAGAASMGIGFLYNGGPLPISRSPLGEVAAGGFLGTVLFLIAFYVLTGSLPVQALLVSLPSLLLIGSVLTVNNTCDIEGDVSAGRRTLSILMGRRAASTLIYLLGALSFGMILCLSILRTLPLLTLVPVLVAAFFSTIEYVRMHRRGYSHATKGPSMGSISRIVLWYTFSVCIGLAVGIVGRFLVPALLL